MTRTFSTTLTMMVAATSLLGIVDAAPTREASLLPKRGIWEEARHVFPLQKSKRGIRRRALASSTQPWLDADAAANGTYTPGPANNGSRMGLAIHGVDELYSVTMMVGTPPLPFKMQIDTGSPWVWVPYTGCASCAGGAQTTGPNVSSTMTMPKDASGSPYTQVFGYGGGQVAAELTEDYVSLGNMSLGKTGVALAGQTQGYSVESYDGILGMSKPSQDNFTEAQGSNYLATLQKNGIIATRQFGLALGRVADLNTTGNHGTFTLGGVDASQIEGSLVEFPDAQPNNALYGGNVTKLTVDGKSVVLNTTFPGALFDSGCTQIIMPDAVAAGIHSLIPGAMMVGDGQTYAIPCNTTSSIAVSIGGASWPIAVKDLMTERADGFTQDNYCQSNIEYGHGVTDMILGDVFLKNVYLAVDMDSKMIGLGKRK